MTEVATMATMAVKRRGNVCLGLVTCRNTRVLLGGKLSLEDDKEKGVETTKC